LNKQLAAGKRLYIFAGNAFAAGSRRDQSYDVHQIILNRFDDL
jgi:hypothetical protein